MYCCFNKLSTIFSANATIKWNTPASANATIKWNTPAEEYFKYVLRTFL